jgi:hypothetical protein
MQCIDLESKEDLVPTYWTNDLNSLFFAARWWIEPFGSLTHQDMAKGFEPGLNDTLQEEARKCSEHYLDWL